MSRIIDAIANAEHVSEYSILMNGNLHVEHAEMWFNNFSGRPTKANPAGGKKTFCLLLSEEMAARLWADDWNIKVKEIKDQYNEDDETMTVKWDEYDSQYRRLFDHGLIYTEVVVNSTGDYPPTIYKASEFNGEKTLAPVPMEHWGEIDRSALSDITVTIHPWKHGRNALKPEAKKGYLNTLIAQIQPIVTGPGLGNTYSGYRVVGA